MTSVCESRPAGWVEAELGELGAWSGGGTPSRSEPAYWEQGDIPWVSPKDMKSTQLRGTAQSITKRATGASAAHLIPAGSIAFVVRSGILSRTLPIALIPFEHTVNQDIRVLTPSASINARWLLNALLATAESIRQSCQKDGTTVASIEVPKLQRFRVPIPPRRDQDRILATLDQQLPRIDTGAANIRKALKGTEQLRIASLGKLFAGDHPRVRIDEVGTVFVGFTPSRKDPTLWDGDVPWVSSGEVAFGRISATRETIADAALGNRDRRLHPPGTVLLAMYGEGKTRGQAAILDVPAATNQAVVAIRVATRMTPEFLFYCLMRKYNEVRATGRGGQQINLNGELIRSIELPQPPMEEQRRLIAELEEWLAAASRLAADLTANLKAADALRRSIMNQAMTGRLVPQDASDEPASELLERVKVEKAQRESAHRRPRRRSPAPSATAG